MINTIKRLKRKLEIKIKTFNVSNPYDPKMINEKKMFVFGTPTYGNLGDQAIAYAQIEFLKKYYSNFTIIEIADRDTFTHIKFVKTILNKNDVIFIQGGGNLGDLYPSIEEERRKVIESFPHNKIIQFPQSYTFTNKKSAENDKLKARKIFGKNKENLIIVSRETKSYHKLRELFNENKHILVPDIVLTLNERKTSKREGILFCLRDDVEQVISMENKNKLINHLRNNYSNIRVTDTVVDYLISKEERYKELSKKWTEYRQSEVVITDRLHGMIFAVITGTPCIVFDNFNQKVQKTYLDWLQGYNFIKFIDVKQNFNIDNIKNEIKTIINQNTNVVNIEDKYKPLIDEINLYLNNR